MTKPVETLQRIPLANLWMAEENARHDTKKLGDIEALRASIIEVGDLIDPLHAYEADGEFKVWDGGRRLAALKGLGKKLPPALKEGVPVLVSASREAALLLSAATFIREAMHPADEFLNYKRLFDAGMAPERIAAACAVTTARVRQLLRMKDVAPAIIDAMRAGELSLDMVEAFTLSHDHEKQLSVLAAVREGGQLSAWRIKGAFKAEALDPTNRWAELVGREAYEAAGGTFLQDLFSSHEDDELWADKALAMSLAEAKVQALIAEAEAEGWARVTFMAYETVSRDYNNTWQKGLERAAGAEQMGPEKRAGVRLYLVQDYNGKIERKHFRPIAKAGAPEAAAEKLDPALYGWGHKGHGVMTQVATEATRVGLLRNPEAAFDAMLTHLAWVALATYPREGTASALLEELRAGRAPDVEVEGAEEWDAAREAWTARFGEFLPNRYGEATPETRTGFCDAVAALTPDEKAALLAFSFGSTLWAYEDKNNYRQKARWAHLGWIARRAGVDMTAAWTPDAEFLKGGSKDALLGALGELGHAGAWASAPKKEMVATVAATAKRERWLPKLLRDLVAAPEAPAAEKPAKGGKGKRAPADDAVSPSLKALATGKAKPIADEDAA